MACLRQYVFVGSVFTGAESASRRTETKLLLCNTGWGSWPPSRGLGSVFCEYFGGEGSTRQQRSFFYPRCGLPDSRAGFFLGDWLGLPSNGPVLRADAAMLAQIMLRVVPLLGCTFLANMGALISDVTRAITVYNTASVRRSDVEKCSLC